MDRTPCPGAPGTARDERILEMLRRLVKIKTEHASARAGAPFGEGCAQALAYVLDECESRGFAVKRVNDMLGWAEVGTHGPLAAFPIHLDVVLAGEGWSHDPFAAEIVDGVLYGRGVMDNKISAAILIELLDELVDGQEDLPCRLRLIFGTDEESGMSDMRSYIAEGGEQPVMGFVPDAAFPVVRGEKAQMHVVLSCNEGLACGMRVFGGTMSNVVPSAAEAVVPPAIMRGPDDAAASELPAAVRMEETSEFTTFFAEGRSAHASTPGRGENAIAALVNHLVDVLPASACGRLADVAALLCSGTDGSALKIASDDDVFGGTTVNLGILEADEGGITLELDIRHGRGIEGPQIVSCIKEAFGPSWSCELAGGKPVHLVAEDDPCVRALLDAYERVTGREGACSVMGGGTYASLLPALVAFGPKFPETHCGAHGIDEHVDLVNIVRATDVYQEALRGIIDLAAHEEE